MTGDPSIEGAVPLQRRLGLTLLVLYGTGITVGAGIYVLIGAVAGHAGIYAPWSFVLAAAVMVLTVASYAELSTRYPVSAGEAAYVRAAFQSRALSTVIGLLTVVTGVVSSAAVTLGSAGYIQQFIDLPQGLIVVIVVAVLVTVAAWGILESVVLASLFTVIEVGGLVIVIVAGIHAGLPIAATIARVPPLDALVWSGIGFGGLLAFFAFIGFEDLANVVEEAKVPNRDIPRAMILTLCISTILYVLVAAVAVSAGPIERLSSSSAPLKSGLSRGCRHQSSDDQCDCDRGDPEYDPRADDDGGSGRLRAGAGRRVAGDFLAGLCANRHAPGCNGLHRGVSGSAGVAGADHPACGRHLAGDAGSVRAGQSCPAVASVSRRGVEYFPCRRPDMGTRGRARDVRCNDGGCVVRINPHNMSRSY
jgi:hypothetical protein